MLSKTKLKNFAALKIKKARDKSMLFFVEGLRLCEAAIQSDFSIETLLINPQKCGSDISTKFEKLARQKNIELIEIDEDDTKNLADTIHSQGVFCVARQKHFSTESDINWKNAFIVIIDAGQDPGNMGTIIRTCDWFGADAVVLSNDSVDLYNPKVVRSTMGSIFHLPVFQNIELTSFIQTLKNQNIATFAADVYGDKFYHQIKYQKPLALLLGNENKGINPELLKLVDHRVKIPSYGKAESLNLASAGAVMISHIVAATNAI